MVIGSEPLLLLDIWGNKKSYNRDLYSYDQVIEMVLKAYPDMVIKKTYKEVAKQKQRWY